MSQSEAGATTEKRGILHAIGWVARFIVFLLTSGYAYPHVCTEGMDMSELDKHTGGDAPGKDSPGKD